MTFQAMFDPNAAEQEIRLTQLFKQDQMNQDKLDAGFSSVQQLSTLHKQLTEMQHEPVDPIAMSMAHRTYQAATEHFGLLAEDIPSLEALSSETHSAFLSLSLESVMRTIGEAVRRIFEFLMKAFRWMSETLGDLLTMEQYQRGRLMYARARVRGLQGIRSSGVNVKLGKRAVMLCTELSSPRTGQDIVNMLRELHSQLNAVRVEYLPMVFSTVDNLMIEARSIKSHENGEDWLAKMNEHAASLTLEPLQRRLRLLRTLNDPRYTRGVVQSSAPLPGCRSLILIDPKNLTDSNDDPVTRGQALQQFGVVLDRVYPDKIVDRMQHEMELMNAQHLLETLGMVEKVLGEMRSGVNGGLRRSIVKTQSLLRQAEKEMTQFDPANTAALERGLQYMRVARDWITKPYLPLVSLALSVATASIDLCQKHMSILEKADNK